MAPIGVVSCKTQVKNPVEMQKNELRSEEDRFLANFVEAGPEGLSVAISREEALFAGATAAGYADLERQVARINAGYDAASYAYWKQTVRQQQSVTKANASFEGTYDKFHVLECDKFLENFVYAENGGVVLKISEEKAVLCGATLEGYESLLGEVAYLDSLVSVGAEDFVEVQKCFDNKRNYIIKNSDLLRMDPDTSPPKYYGSIELRGTMRQDSQSIYGPEKLDAHIYKNYFSGSVVLEEQDRGKRVSLSWGYSSVTETFEAGLVYPEGGHYSFVLTKGTDNYDASAYFVEHKNNL